MVYITYFYNTVNINIIRYVKIWMLIYIYIAVQYAVYKYKLFIEFLMCININDLLQNKLQKCK